MLASSFSGAKVLVTGHTGFKGSWLCALLNGLGAEVFGLSNGVPKDLRHSYFKLEVPEMLHQDTLDFDVRDLESLRRELGQEKYDFVFHLAANAIVSDCVANPIEAFTTNSIGVANILEASRSAENPPTLVLITSDKCYLPDVSALPYSESHYLGGTDPYSASKAAAELFAHSMMETFPESWANGVATARAGNVFGGGDWSPNRLVPDMVRMIQSGSDVQLRLPEATRPWTYVLDVVRGYVVLASALRARLVPSGESWNFASGERKTVADFAEKFLELRPEVSIIKRSSDLAEVGFLELDASKASSLLGWKPLRNLDEQITTTHDWYSQPTNVSSRELRRQFVAPYLEA